MKTLIELGDDMAPIEETEGYVGHSWEGGLHYWRIPAELSDQPLMALQKFDWSTYRTLLEESRTFMQCQLRLDLPTGSKVVTYNATHDIAYLIDELPSVEVYEAGAGFVFTAADEDAVEADVGALLIALTEDLSVRLKIRNMQH